MYERIKMLYLANELTEQQVINAVNKKWLTAEEAEEIISSKNDKIEIK